MYRDEKQDSATEFADPLFQEKKCAFYRTCHVEWQFVLGDNCSGRCVIRLVQKLAALYQRG